ncbi:GTP cyclohydrolase [Nocardia sp. 2]|uniref:GTP cyclohydrolase n=1 Tax=Nocardia acididurans TaxID=2802282 RepID=A0ABS1MB10_9NOCA|nr:GTP cyclohydrolase [Nocardia acididurans]MBL1076944.1 GTP cyclohydrolase [Nocardia acididurans]
MKDLRATAHSLSRKGQELQVQVMELRDDTEQVSGHLLLFGSPCNGCLVRIHSRCLYGDALQSDDCDCGPELELALDMIQAEEHGVLLYLEQEGRGSGLVVKAMGLRLAAEADVDTFTSYRMLGHPIDSRCYRRAAESLVKDLDLQSVRLMTNNPAKVEAARAVGLEVRQVRLRTAPRSARALRYMRDKQQLGGHDPAISESGDRQ